MVNMKLSKENWNLVQIGVKVIFVGIIYSAYLNDLADGEIEALGELKSYPNDKFLKSNRAFWIVRLTHVMAAEAMYFTHAVDDFVFPFYEENFMQFSSAQLMAQLKTIYENMLKTYRKYSDHAKFKNSNQHGVPELLNAFQDIQSDYHKILTIKRLHEKMERENRAKQRVLVSKIQEKKMKKMKKKELENAKKNQK